MMLPANGSLRRVLAILSYAAGLVAVLGSAAVAVDARYARVEDVQTIRQDIVCLGRGLKLSNLRLRERLLVQETSRIEIARTQRPLSPVEMQRYNEALNDQTRVQSMIQGLDQQSGCER